MSPFFLSRSLVESPTSFLGVVFALVFASLAGVLEDGLLRTASLGRTLSLEAASPLLCVKYTG